MAAPTIAMLVSPDTTTKGGGPHVSLFLFRPPSSSTSRESKMSLRLLISAFLGFWEVFSHSLQPTVTNGASRFQTNRFSTQVFHF